MVISNVLQGDIWTSPLSDLQKGESGKIRGISIEKKIEFLENLIGGTSNRRSRRCLNDRLLIELVPRLDAEEIRGLFAPPPWGVDAPLSPFCMTNIGGFDEFRNVDIDKEASMIESLENLFAKKKGCTDDERVLTLDAWHRVECETRTVLRQSFVQELIKHFEKCLRAFIDESRDDVLVLHVRDPFHRLLLHGVCKFYNLDSATFAESESLKATKIKKTKCFQEVPKLPLSHFLKISKEGIW